jgi:aryl-phospho-beta-D-glucosidase BglC (GH1 family)
MIQDIHNAGLNTIRIPIGYWSLRSNVDSIENFPNLNLQYLDAVIQKAADLGMFVVIDLHGAPGAQKTSDAFTGQVHTVFLSWTSSSALMLTLILVS